MLEIFLYIGIPLLAYASPLVQGVSLIMTTLSQGLIYAVYPHLLETILTWTGKTARHQPNIIPKKPNYPLITFNVLIVNYIAGWLMSPFLQTNPLTFPVYLYELLMLTLIYMPGFYWLHRLFHRPWLYAHIHKYHHRHKAPMAITAVDTHPIEHLCVNLGPLIIGSILIMPHSLSVLVLAVIGTISTLNGHSGWACFQPHHDDHHRRTTGYYGFQLMDSLFGT